MLVSKRLLLCCWSLKCVETISFFHWQRPHFPRVEKFLLVWKLLTLEFISCQRINHAALTSAALFVHVAKC